MAIIQHASASFANNQCNGMSDKEGRLSHSEVKCCIVIVCMYSYAHKILMKLALIINSLSQVSA